MEWLLEETTPLDQVSLCILLQSAIPGIIVVTIAVPAVAVTIPVIIVVTIPVPAVAVTIPVIIVVTIPVPTVPVPVL